MFKKPSNAEILISFKSMRIKHPGTDKIEAVFDTLRATAADPGPKDFASVFAPSQSGKSTAVKSYIEKVVVPQAVERGLLREDLDLHEQCKQQTLVVHVTLEGGATPRSLCADILNELGDKRGVRGNKSNLLRRVYDLLKTLNVELLIIDEIQHLSVSKHMQREDEELTVRMNRSSDVTDTLKAMLIRGVVPMVFIGVDSAREYLFCDEQLALRCYEEVDFSELDWGDSEERTIFTEFCGRLGARLKKDGIFPQSANLLAGDIPHCLHQASKGRLGILCRVVQKACMHAAAADAETVHRDHLMKAVDTFAIPRGVIDHNPFRTGAREVKFKKI